MSSCSNAVKNIISALSKVSRLVKTVDECLKWIKIINQSISQVKKILSVQNNSVQQYLQFETYLAHLKFYRNKIKFLENELKNRRNSTQNLKWEELESCFRKRIKCGIIINFSLIDLDKFLEKAFRSFAIQIKKCLRNSLVKVQTILFANFIKPQSLETDIKHLTTKSESIYRDTNLKKWYKQNVKDVILEKLDSFQEKDSGWALYEILSLKVNINSYNPVSYGISTYIKVPKFLQKSKSILNIQNNDPYCFLWSLMASKFPCNYLKHPTKTSSYASHRFQDVFKYEGIKFPIKMKDIPKFEKMNSISINVFGISEKKKILPIQLSSFDFEEKVNLLVLEKNIHDDDYDDDEDCSRNIVYHFALIKNLSGLLSKQLPNKKNKKFFCDRCFQHFKAQSNLDKHYILCRRKNFTKINMHTEEKKFLKFKNFKNAIEAPFVIYADIESLLMKNSDFKATATKQRYHRHEAFSIGYYLKCSFDENLSKFRIYTGENCISWFVKELAEIATYVEEFMRNIAPLKLTNEEEVSFLAENICFICGNPFNEPQNYKVRDHIHYGKGKWRGAAHRNCNLNYQDTNDINVIFHNFSSYDSHFLLKSLCNDIPGRMSILPLNKEKFISFTKFIDNTKIRLKFIDSYRFMSSSLDKLASYLSDECKKTVAKFCKNDLEFKLLQKKGIFPYEYLDSWEKLNERNLPSIEKFYSNIKGKHISKTEYEHACMVWEVFGIENLQQYAELYLKTDVLLLTDIFENFRSVCMKNYKLDPVHYYTAPGLSFDAMLKMTGVELELLTDIDQLMYVESAIRGGISQVSNRYGRANNKFLSDYNDQEESSFLIYLDVNNLYGKAMSQILPFGEFQWVQDIYSLPYILDIPHDNPYGFIYEVDLIYPPELFEKHKDLPLCPQREIPPAGKIPKLLNTLFDKKKYIIHYHALKQAVQLGLKIGKIHRVLQFRQSYWLKTYVDLNIELRKASQNDFEINFFKLMINSVYGKMLENPRKYRDIKVVNKWGGRYGCNYYISKPNFHSSVIIDENLVIIEMNRLEITFNKPIYVGMSILDISKTFLFDFHYNHIKSDFDEKAKLLYTDTDSLIYHIFTDDFYDYMKEHIELFDTSNFPSNNKYGLPLVNKKEIGKMKDENGGRLMTEFVGLKSKMYSLKLEVSDEEIVEMRNKCDREGLNELELEKCLANIGIIKKAKGCQQSSLRSITFNDYYECLFQHKNLITEQNSIRSEKHQVYTVKSKKLTLNNLDDKRNVNYLFTDTVPWGYRKI